MRGRAPLRLPQSSSAEAVASSQTRHELGTVAAHLARYVVLDGDSDHTLGGDDVARGGGGASTSRRQAVHDTGRAARDERGERLVRFSYSTAGACDAGRSPCGSGTSRSSGGSRAHAGASTSADRGDMAGSRTRSAERSRCRRLPRRRPRIRSAIKPSRSGTPPVGPRSGSTACSGCGIRPRTLPVALPRRRRARESR